MSTFGNYGTCCHDGVALHYTPVQDDGSHTNKYIVLKGTAVYDGIMPYRDIIADSGRGFLIGTMYHHIILYIYLVANDNSIHIAPKDSVVPYTTVLSKSNLPNKDGSLGDKYIFSYNGGFPPKFPYDRHMLLCLLVTIYYSSIIPNFFIRKVAFLFLHTPSRSL